eukprot:749357-Hanusia_phi.AAC.1
MGRVVCSYSRKCLQVGLPFLPSEFFSCFHRERMNRRFMGLQTRDTMIPVIREAFSCAQAVLEIFDFGAPLCIYLQDSECIQTSHVLINKPFNRSVIFDSMESRMTRPAGQWVVPESQSRGGDPSGARYCRRALDSAGNRSESPGQ